MIYRRGLDFEAIREQADQWYAGAFAHLPEPYKSAIRRTIDDLDSAADVAILRVYIADARDSYRRRNAT